MTVKEIFEKIAKLPTVDYWNNGVNYEELLKKHESFFRKMIDNRIDHCECQLAENINKAQRTQQIIVWEGGHFSIPVWTELVNSRKQKLTEWSALVWEQIIRQMGRENEHFDAVLWDIASEMLLCSNPTE